MPPAFEIFRRLGWRGAGEAAGVLVFLLILAQMQASHNRKVEAECRLAGLRLAYQNPAKRERTRTVVLSGPVRIRTVVVEKPTGEKVTTTEEDRGAVSSTAIADSEEKPVALPGLSERREDRWLLSFGVNRLTKDVSGKALLVGYGWGNRLDLQAGIIDDDRARPWILATLRF